MINLAYQRASFRGNKSAERRKGNQTKATAIIFLTLIAEVQICLSTPKNIWIQFRVEFWKWLQMNHITMDSAIYTDLLYIFFGSWFVNANIAKME